VVQTLYRSSCGSFDDHFEILLEYFGVRCAFVERNSHLGFDDERRSEQRVDWEVVGESDHESVVLVGASLSERNAVFDHVGDTNVSVDSFNGDVLFPYFCQINDSMD